jgi:hypothetical protein
MREGDEPQPIVLVLLRSDRAGRLCWIARAMQQRTGQGRLSSNLDAAVPAREHPDYRACVAVR